MNGIYLTREEFDALRGQSNLAVRLYIHLRFRMDLASRTVGQVRPISYQALAEDCETAIRKGAGWQIMPPTRKQLRVAIANLERGALLRRLSDDAPVFLLARAPDISARQKQTGPEQDRSTTHAKPCTARVWARTGQTNSIERGTHQRSEEKHPFSIAAAGSTPRPVDKSTADGAAALVEMMQIRIGYPIRHHADDPRFAEWTAKGMDFDVLVAAAQAAKAARERDNNRAPLNPGYISAFLGAPDDWTRSWSGICRKGESLGVMPQPGEASPIYKARVFAAAH